jgi:hypothetical protein
MEVNCENVSFQKMFASYGRVSDCPMKQVYPGRTRPARLPIIPCGEAVSQIPFSACTRESEQNCETPRPQTLPPNRADECFVPADSGRSFNDCSLTLLRFRSREVLRCNGFRLANDTSVNAASSFSSPDLAFQNGFVGGKEIAQFVRENAVTKYDQPTAKSSRPDNLRTDMVTSFSMLCPEEQSLPEH